MSILLPITCFLIFSNLSLLLSERKINENPSQSFFLPNFFILFIFLPCLFVFHSTFFFFFVAKLSFLPLSLFYFSHILFFSITSPSFVTLSLSFFSFFYTLSFSSFLFLFLPSSTLLLPVRGRQPKIFACCGLFQESDS